MTPQHVALRLRSIEDQAAARSIAGARVPILLLIGLVFMFDGFDTQAIAFAGPSITREFGVSLASLGPLLTSGMLGGLIGAVGLGAISDRAGRRLTLILCILMFCAGTITTAYIHDFRQLTVLRLATGFGLGGALPTLYALAAVYAPTGKKAFTVTLASCGIPLGGVVGGLICARLIPEYGWRMVFQMGGLLPLLILPFIWRMVPMRLSTARTDATPAISRTHYIRALFAAERKFSTPLLWMICLPATLTCYFLVNWTPALAERAGLSMREAIFAGVLVNGGGIIGGLIMSGLIDRLGPMWVMSSGFLVAALSIGALGFSSAAPLPFLGNMLVVGMTAVGCSMCVGTLSSLAYPEAVRGVGVGFAIMFARIGAVLGPLAGGAMVALGLPTSTLFFVVSLSSLVALCAMVGLGIVTRRSGAGFVA